MVTEKTIIFEDDSFEFCKVKGIGINNTPYENYKVNTKRNTVMDRNSIEIRIHNDFHQFNGEPVVYKPQEVSVNFGLSSEPLQSIEQFCKCLNEASLFAMKVGKELQIPFINR